eukprot:TRINITY_DN1034_c0_g1_i2.p1 TRINITY_DN1034_c0_g1~~TRINITY_DN1034_c0_g1_i2.p1  ORF type:complete len:261 (+),score=40.41 TRINITY_DN1034_c0_g1_i2:40-822(+)
MKAIFVFALLVCFVHGNEDQFQQWMKLHKKHYSDQNQYQERLINYLKNSELVNTLNSKHPNARFTINKYADLSSEEFKKSKFVSRPVEWGLESSEPLAFDSNVAPPSSFDWRSHNLIYPIRDENECGDAGMLYTTTENVAGTWMVLHSLTTDDFPPLSRQQIIDCSPNNDGCNGGFINSIESYILSAHGLESEANYPWVGTTGTCKFNPKLLAGCINSWKPLNNLYVKLKYHHHHHHCHHNRSIQSSCLRCHQKSKENGY